MYPGELKKLISRGEIAPLYFFSGDNTHLIEETIAHIRSCLFASQNPDLDLNYFDAQTHAPSEIIQPAMTFPFASPKRLVIVKRSHAFNEGQWESFQGYFAKPSKYCCLVFTAEKLSIKGKLLKTFQKNGELLSFVNPRGKGRIKDFVRSGLDGFGKRITPEALSYLADNMAEDAGKISSELEKIALFCGDKQTIDIADLEEIVSDDHTATIFNLVDEIGRGDIENSLMFLSNLLGGGVYPLVILKMIARQFRLISMAKEGVANGESSAAIGRRLNLRYENLIRNIMLQARGWPLDGLSRAFTEIFQSNVMIKSSRIDGKVILEDLLFKLVSLRNQPPA